MPPKSPEGNWYGISEVSNKSFYYKLEMYYKEYVL